MLCIECRDWLFGLINLFEWLIGTFHTWGAKLRIEPGPATAVRRIHFRCQLNLTSLVSHMGEENKVGIEVVKSLKLRKVTEAGHA